MDSYNCRLRAIFHSIGRNGEWDKRLALGNPASGSVNDFLRLVTAEKLKARATPKQATPFFVDKLIQLCSHLDKKLRDSDRAIRELKHATFLRHGRQPEVNISHARTVVFSRFSN